MGVPGFPEQFGGIIAPLRHQFGMAGLHVIEDREGAGNVRGGGFRHLPRHRQLIRHIDQQMQLTAEPLDDFGPPGPVFAGSPIFLLEFRTPPIQAFFVGGKAANPCWPSRWYSFLLWWFKRSDRGMVMDGLRMTPQTGLSAWHIRAIV